MLKTIALIFLASACYGQTFQLHGSADELSGAVVTPAVGPPGQGVVNGTGTISFLPLPAPAPGTSGAYFTNCCAVTNNAYYKFGSVASVFAPTGQITFFLTSRYAWADRQNFTGSRYAFDVLDSAGVHQFGLSSNVGFSTSGKYLYFTAWGPTGKSVNYFVPKGSEDMLFGIGVTIRVAVTWTGTSFTFAVNGATVATGMYSATWSVASLFIGAQGYAGAGYHVSDDAISEFTVTGTVPPPTDTPPIFTSAANATFLGGAASGFSVVTVGSPAPSVVESGILPDGITFNPMTGSLSGTPTSLGTYGLTFTALNSAGTASQTFTLTVAPPPTSVVNCTGTYNAAAGTVSLNCLGNGLIPANVFSNLSVLITLPGNLVAQWQTDRQYIAAFSSK